MKTVTSPGGFPNKPHFAALTFSHIHIPGDERSHQAPGHGHPVEDKPVAEYIVFDSEEEMKKWAADEVEYRTGFPSPPGFVVFHVNHR